MTQARAYSALDSSSPLVPTTIERRALGDADVLIEISYAGICHSDVHTARGEWGTVEYPLTVGHEIVGTVISVGDDVTAHRVGDFVGVGCMVGSCGTCENCLAALEQYCLAGMTATYGGVDRDGTITQGGYSSHIVVDEHFVLKIPDGVPLDSAAPLLCAGITTYSPLRHWKAGPGCRVAVVGLGGLGHMAVKFAVALGAEVSVLSRTDDKAADAIRLGAHYYHATSDAGSLDNLANTYDLIINTVSAPLDMGAYLSLLRLDGTLVNVGAPPEPLPVPVFTLFGNRRSFSGSSIGSVAETQEMLEFAAEHSVFPETELISADQINEAWERMLDADVRYRFVIDASTI